MRYLAVLAILLIGLFGWRHWREVSRENRLGGIASEIAGRPVGVSCQGFFSRLVDVRPEAGMVYFDANGNPSNATKLKSWVCDRLAGYGSTRRSQSFACVRGSLPCPDGIEKSVTALLVLAHESEHLRGVRSESEAQCYGIQRIALVAERLGSDPDEARAVAAHFLAVQQPLQLPDYQLGPDCQDGGRLDLDPSRTGWPSP
ncbi:MAG: hypothetical protein ACXVZ1_06900 [Gaiellaceae bacterium]